MICQVSLFTLKPGVSPDRLEEILWFTRTTLLRIREVLHLHVGKRIRPGDPWHWFLSIEAENLDKLAILQDDPHYYKFWHEVVVRSVETQQTVVFEMDPRKDVRYS